MTSTTTTAPHAYADHARMLRGLVAGAPASVAAAVLDAYDAAYRARKAGHGPDRAAAAAWTCAVDLFDVMSEVVR